MSHKSEPRQIPLHQQIAVALREEIANGGLQAGYQLPSENDLARKFGVSRGTVRQARAALRADGTIAGSQGRRLAVSRPQLTQPLSQLISFSAWTESLGKTPSARVLETGLAKADEEIAAALNIDLGSDVYQVTRIRLADGIPLMIERTTFVSSLTRHLSEIDLANRSIYAELEARGVSIHSARHLLSAFAASRVDARHLGLPAGAPLLRVRRIGFSSGGEALEWSDDRYRGDQINFAIENSSVVSGVARRMSQ